MWEECVCVCVLLLYDREIAENHWNRARPIDGSGYRTRLRVWKGLMWRHIYNACIYPCVIDRDLIHGNHSERRDGFTERDIDWEYDT